MRTAQLLTPIAALMLCGTVVLTDVERQTTTTTATANLAELWIEPADLERRNLLRGPSEGPPPDPATPFTFVARDTSGKSPGYDVRDRNGMTWSVKLEVEAQSEVAASRILWAIGFHQPPTYYLSNWTMTGEEAGPKSGARFRPELLAHKVTGEWKWDENPFAGTRPLNGLLVAQMILNNWDLKSSNNKIYEVDGASPPRRYVVRDLGAAFGYNRQSRWISWLGIRGSQGSKNDVDGFEKAGFIDKVENGRVDFSYRGPNSGHLKNITPADVQWTCELMARLSDEQWQDAFRAAGYAPDIAERYVAKLKEKVAQGLALQRTTITQR